MLHTDCPVSGCLSTITASQGTAVVTDCKFKTTRTHLSMV